MFFKYGETELSYLKAKDKKLSVVIEKLGFIKREIEPDIFSSLVHHIIGQQISGKAQATIWMRLQDRVKNISPNVIGALADSDLQALGINGRKAYYIKSLAQKVLSKELDLDALSAASDADVIKILTQLDGIGVWTVQMILIFCLARPNVLAFTDSAIIKGMRMIYKHRKIDKKLFTKYQKRLSPYCTVASFYFWAVANGVLEDV